MAVSTFAHSCTALGSGEGSSWDATIPATPVSRSHHQKQLDKPDQWAVCLERPVTPGEIMKPSPHPCGSLPGQSGYSSSDGYTSSGLTTGRLVRVKSGSRGSLYSNIIWTVSGWRMALPVRGEVPLFNRTLRSSVDKVRNLISSRRVGRRSTAILARGSP